MHQLADAIYLDPYAFEGLAALSCVFYQREVGQPSQNSGQGVFQFMVQALQESAAVLGKFLLGIFNQLLLSFCAVMVFLLASQLFDRGVAWLSMIIFLGTDVYWKFSTSGHSTVLLLLIFLGLLWVLARLEFGVNHEGWSGTKPLLMAALVGVLLSLGFLTRYAFGWLLIPTLLFLLFFHKQ